MQETPTELVLPIFSRGRGGQSTIPNRQENESGEQLSPINESQIRNCNCQSSGGAGPIFVLPMITQPDSGDHFAEQAEVPRNDSDNGYFVPTDVKLDIAYALGKGATERNIATTFSVSKTTVHRIARRQRRRRWAQAGLTYKSGYMQYRKQIQRHFVCWCLLNNPRASYLEIHKKARDYGIGMSRAAIARCAHDRHFVSRETKKERN